MCFLLKNTATTEISSLSLHDALRICVYLRATNSINSYGSGPAELFGRRRGRLTATAEQKIWRRSEVHTSEFQSRLYLVCRLLLENIRGIINMNHKTFVLGAIFTILGA